MSEEGATRPMDLRMKRKAAEEMEVTAKKLVRDSIKSKATIDEALRVSEAAAEASRKVKEEENK